MLARPAMLSRLSASPAALAYALLCLLIAAATALNPSFASLDNLRAQLVVGSIIGTVAAGQTVLIITGQIDLSAPWTITAAAMAAAILHGRGYGDAPAVAAAVGVGLGVGLVNSVGVAVFRVQSLVWTLAVNTTLQGLVLVVTDSQPPKAGVPELARTLAVGSVAGVPWAALLWAGLALLAIVGLRCTTVGRVVYATGLSPLTTLFSGIDVRRTYLFGFALSGLCSALAGLLLAGYASEAYLGMGNDYLLLPIAAVVVGGTSILGGSGGYVGTVAGVLIMLTLQSTLSVAQITQGGKDIILGLLILCTIVLYGRRDVARA